MISINDESVSRREFLKKTGLLLTGATAIGNTVSVAQAQEKEKEQQNEKVSLLEDLMREHGVLSRILLIYEEIQKRLNSGKAFAPQVLSGAAETIHRFIEEYHEKLEEEYLFPRFEKADKLFKLVGILKQQHKAGRYLTEFIKTSAVPATLKDVGKRRELAAKITLFIRMYRPHASREDTVLFPAFHNIASSQEFDSLSEEFEEREEALFGEGGFERVVGEVAKLEKALGIYELAQFTPLN